MTENISALISYHYKQVKIFCKSKKYSEMSIKLWVWLQFSSQAQSTVAPASENQCGFIQFQSEPEAQDSTVKNSRSDQEADARAWGNGLLLKRQLRPSSAQAAAKQNPAAQLFRAESQAAS